MGLELCNVCWVGNSSNFSEASLLKGSTGQQEKFDESPQCFQRKQKKETLENLQWFSSGFPYRISIGEFWMVLLKVANVKDFGLHPASGKIQLAWPKG